MRVSWSIILLVVLVELCSCQAQIGEYLDIRNVSKYDAIAFDWLVQKLSGVKDTEVRDYVRRNVDNLPKDMDDTKLVAVADLLNSLAELGDNSTNCSAAMTNHFVLLVGRTFGSIDEFSNSADEPTHDRALYYYLKHYGSRKFSRCLEELSALFEEALGYLDKKKEKIFNELIESQSKYQPLDDRKLSQVAKSIDLTDNQTFKARRLLRVAREYKEKSLLGQSAKFLLTFLSGLCSQLRSPFKSIFNVYNVARLMSPEAKSVGLSDKFHKLNEYSRICLQYQDPETREQVEQTMASALKTWKWLKKVASQ